MVRLAVVTWPPYDVRSVLAALSRPSTPGVIWSAPEQWMVKLRPLGHVSEELWPDLQDALHDALDGMPAVPCALGPTTRLLAGTWLGVPVTGLDDLAAEVFDATDPLVPVTHPQPYEADVVLARGHVPRRLAGEPVSAAWIATSVALVADRSSPRRPMFEEIDAVPLGAAVR